MPLYRTLVNRTLIPCLVSAMALLAAAMLPASASDRQSAAITAVGSLISDPTAVTVSYTHLTLPTTPYV